jgi:hypothetical protein
VTRFAGDPEVRLAEVAQHPVDEPVAAVHRVDVG